jgi:hypothetical protein
MDLKGRRIPLGGVAAVIVDIILVPDWHKPAAPLPTAFRCRHRPSSCPPPWQVLEGRRKHIEQRSGGRRLLSLARRTAAPLRSFVNNTLPRERRRRRIRRPTSSWPPPPTTAASVRCMDRRIPPYPSMMMMMLRRRLPLAGGTRRRCPRYARRSSFACARSRVRVCSCGRVVSTTLT